MALTTLSSQNQVTVPKHILDSLSLKSHDKLFVKKSGAVIVLEPIDGSVAEKTFGSLAEYVTPDKENKSLDEIMKITKKKTAQKLMRD